jgi:imidazole glycerol-phosphate synthase subunit HisH
MIVIVDYGMGNMHSVKRAIEYVAPRSKVLISSNHNDIKNASKIILPGQGAMPDCMKALKASNLQQVLMEAITVQHKPTLGICVGMQMLFENSEESHITGSTTAGLGILTGKIKKFPSIANIKVPHMGWNRVKYNQYNDIKSKLFHSNDNIAIEQNSFFYFVHSYYLDIYGIDKGYKIATCNYGLEFSCAIEHNNLFATQFHPEKSSDNGLAVYQNFINNTNTSN